MKIKYKKSFEKDLEKLPEKFIIHVFEIISILESTENLQDIWNIKKLSWFKNTYRIKLWDFRMWFMLRDNEIVLERLLHRKDIYKHFPK